jgi:hypothetical protein
MGKKKDGLKIWSCGSNGICLLGPCIQITPAQTLRPEFRCIFNNNKTKPWHLITRKGLEKWMDQWEGKS